jgi:hypothetical protein
VTSLKPGVKLGSIRPEMAVALAIAASVFERLGIDCTVTSAMDGEHAAKSVRHPRSLHYEGLALDLRLPSKQGARAASDAVIADALRAALGVEFDVVLEVDHLHLEFDPKPAAPATST